MEGKEEYKDTAIYSLHREPENKNYSLILNYLHPAY
jgi:hypothetical protein